MTTNQIIRISAIVASLVRAGGASASILAKVDAAASPGTFTGPAVVQIVGANAATARLTATAVPGGFVNQGYTSTVFGDSTCLFCNQSLDARVTGDGSGTVKLFNGVGLTLQTQGIAFVDLQLDDVVDTASPSIGINLNSFFSAFDRGPATFFPFMPYNTDTSFQMTLDLQGFDPNDPDNSGHAYSFLMLAFTSYNNNAIQAASEHWYIQQSVDAGPLVTLSEGSSLAALGGHLGLSTTVDTSGSPSWQLSFAVHSESICTGGAPGMTCTAMFDGWNTSHLGLAGTFTSESGYTYDGFAAPIPAVPEPGTLALVFAAAVGVGRRIWKGRHRVKRGGAVLAGRKNHTTRDGQCLHGEVGPYSGLRRNRWKLFRHAWKIG